MSIGRVIAAALAITLVLPIAMPAPVRASTGTLPPAEDCNNHVSATAKATADQIMAGRLKLQGHPDFALPANPTWREKPFHADQNWLFNYHALRWLLPLFQAGRDTGDATYTNRATFLLRDWLASNPHTSTATLMAWNDMATGWRASVMACAIVDLGQPAWLAAGLKSHGIALADKAFYSWHGNHALNQAIGLLDVGCATVVPAWTSLAASRIAGLVLESVDPEGATNEQSVGYELYNYDQYQRAGRHLTDCGRPVPAAFSRIALMPEFLAHATDPDRTYAQLGDTDLRTSRRIVGTVAEFAASAGVSGPKPTTIVKRYAAGFLFARSGWGESRPFGDETYLTLRFGRGLAYHGQQDGQSVTLSARGHRLVVDPGLYTFTAGPWKDYFESRAAHNVVLVDGLKYDRTKATGIGSYVRPGYLYAATTNSGYAGVANKRRLVWSRGADYLIVDDQLSSTVDRTFRQTWHLARGTAPTVSGRRVDANFTEGNLAIVQLVGRPGIRIVSGQTSPIQGWVSEEYQTKYKAAVVQASVRARSARFLTLLVPYSGARPVIRGVVVKLTSSGFVADVTIGGTTERVTAAGSTVTIAPR